jgi:membrane protein
MSEYGDDTQDAAPAGKAPAKRVSLSPERTDALRARGVELYGRADTRSHGVLGIAWAGVQSFMQTEAAASAASITYYALISLFPLIVFALTLLDGIFGADRVVYLLEAWLDAVLPVGGEYFHSFLDQTASTPTSLQFFSALVLLWSASSLFVEITRHVEEAWQPLGARVSPLRDRTLGVVAVGGIVVLVGAIVLTSMVLSIVPRVLNLLIPGLNDLLGAVLALLLPWLLPPLLIWVLLFGLYMLAPNVKVWPVAAAWAAGIAAVIWLVVHWGFGLWAITALFRYQQLYGSLATVIILMLWMYAVAVIVLGGAQVCAAIQQHHSLPHQPDAVE